MGSYDYDTQRTNPAGVGNKNSHAATEVAETEEVKHLKSQYKNELTKLQELFTEWSEADLLFALQENQGELELTINRIMEGLCFIFIRITIAAKRIMFDLNSHKAIYNSVIMLTKRLRFRAAIINFCLN
jgi:hypothetical protein